MLFNSSVNKVIKAILNPLLFYEKISHAQKARKQANKKRQHFYAHKNYLRRRKLLVRLFVFLCFLCFLCCLCFLCLLCVKFFRKKNKEVSNCFDDLIHITTFSKNKHFVSDNSKYNQKLPHF